MGNAPDIYGAEDDRDDPVLDMLAMVPPGHRIVPKVCLHRCWSRNAIGGLDRTLLHAFGQIDCGRVVERAALQNRLQLLQETVLTFELSVGVKFRLLNVGAHTSSAGL